MKQAVLDTNFILSCINQKIDFFEEMFFMGIKILIPKQVIRELTEIEKSKKEYFLRENAKLALELFKKNNFKLIDLKEQYVDKGIINFAEKNKTIIVATLDKEIKKKILNSKLIIRRGKKLEII